MRRSRILVTCEHASNSIPVFMRAKLPRESRILQTHRAFDSGAKKISRLLSKNLRASLVEGTISRLAIDLNRSPRNRLLFSSYSKGLSKSEKKRLFEEFYNPFRFKAYRFIKNWLRNSRSTTQVFHLSVHSFTPVLKGSKRSCEIGILYDPGRPTERFFAQCLRKQLLIEFPKIRVRLNYPYKGTSDGHCTLIRRTTAHQQSYIGVEIEFNQKWLKYLDSNTGQKTKRLASAINHAIKLTQKNLERS